MKNSQNNNITGNNKYSGSLSHYLEHNISHNNNLFSESYNAQFDLGKENDNVNIYKPDDEDDIIDAKEKELNKYRNEVDNIINNFKTKKESNNNSINTTNENQILYSSQNLLYTFCSSIQLEFHTFLFHLIISMMIYNLYLLME